jgi:hypothetical protein
MANGMRVVYELRDGQKSSLGVGFKEAIGAPAIQAPHTPVAALSYRTCRRPSIIRGNMLGKNH